MNTSGLTSVTCPIHTSEPIQRVDTEFGSEKEFYCIECLLNIDNPADKKTLKPLKQLIEQAAAFYQENRKRSEENIETPAEYLDILSRQQENLETLTERIEKEK
mmetsp:Transcript_17652/g.15466  ORF Transcript_17652/g.15466 Transcript_17652/m.15466 type:complete len:104 (+) Transcript_17652:91-402(+)